MTFVQGVRFPPVEAVVLTLWGVRAGGGAARLQRRARGAQSCASATPPLGPARCAATATTRARLRASPGQPTVPRREDPHHLLDHLRVLRRLAGESLRREGGRGAHVGKACLVEREQSATKGASN